MTANNRNAVYACINLHGAACPVQLVKRAVCIQDDIGLVIEGLLMRLNTEECPGTEQNQ